VNTYGNTIHLADGSYSESGRLTINPGVSIQGASMEGTIIHLTYHNGTAEDACFYLYSSTLTAGNQSISYLTLDGGNTGGKAILVRRRHNVDIAHVTVKDFLWGGIHYRNQDGWRTPPAVYASGSEVIECIITNCSDRTYASYDPGNLRIDGQMNFDVFEVKMRNNQRPAGHNGNLFNMSFCHNVRAWYCEFIKPDGDGGQWNFYGENFHLRGGIDIGWCSFTGVANLNFSNAAPDGYSTRGSYDYTVDVHDCTFTTASGSQISRSLMAHNQAAITFEKGFWDHCHVRRNHIYRFPFGVTVCAPVDHTIEFSHIYIESNLLENIGYSDHPYTWGIAWLLENNGSYGVTMDHMYVQNNTITGGSGYNYNGIRWVANGTATNIYIRNNIIYGWDQGAAYIPKQSGESASFNGLTITNECYYGNGGNYLQIASDITQVSSDLDPPLTSNPNFVSSTDFHLTEGSPCREAGTSSAGVELDLDGISYYTPPSMGCYEYTSSPIPPETLHTYYVAPYPTGNNSTGNGSSEAPWATIAHAFSESTAGDVVYMTAGTYTISSQVTLPTGVSLHGIGTVRIEATYASTNQALIKGESTSGWAHPSIAGNQTISNITFDGNMTTWIAIQINFRHNVRIYGCTFIDFYHRGVVFYGQASDQFGGTNPYDPTKSMPDGWCTGNKCYSCTFINCGRNIGSSPYNGYGNLNIGQQDGFEAYNLTIVQTARASGYNGYGIKFYEGGWNKNTKIYDCDITCDIDRPQGGWNFSLEMWNDLGGCEYYDNRLRGQVDLTNSVLADGFEYTSWFHDNVIGWDEMPDHTEAGITLEAWIESVIISDNTIMNVSNGISMQQLYPIIPEWRLHNYMEEIQIYNNLIYNLGITGDGWTYGGVVGIAFTEDDGDKTGKNCYIYNNTIVSATTDVRDDTYRVVGINYNCLTDWDGLYIRNNIIVNFDGGYSQNAPIQGIGYSEMNDFVITNNIFYNCGNSGAPSYISGFDTGTGYVYSDNILLNPQFVSSSDFHLQETSPAIGRGIWVGISKDKDDYDYSTIGPAVGCYEYLSEIPDEPDPPEPPVVVWKRARKGGRYITKQGKYVMMRE